MRKSSDKLISGLLFSLLPVQILILAMGSINTIVGGAMAGRYIDATSVGVIGLYFSMVNILNSVGAVLLGGTAVLCGRYMGRGEIAKTEGIFSLNLTITFVIGAFMTVISFLIPGPLALLLGSGEALKDELMQYIIGYGIGILPMLLGQQIASFLQMERQNIRGYVGIAVMISSNVLANILLVGILKMGIWGLALATSFSNIAYFLVLAQYYFTKKPQLRYSFRKILWADLVPMITIGIPGALLTFCIALRVMVINRILLTYAGNDGLSAMAALAMINGLLIAYCLGFGAVVRMLTSVFVGEENRASIRNMFRIVFTKGLALSVVIALLLLAIAPLGTSLFFPDRSSNVYRLALELFMIISACVPLIFVCSVFTNYLQAMGFHLCVNIQSVFDGFFSMVIPSAILAPYIGAMGVWLANPIGIVLTLLLIPLFALVYWKKIPKSVDEWLFIRPSFGLSADDFLDIPIHKTADVTAASLRIQEFCEAHDMSKKTSYYAALCLEEMAVNVVSHGFHADAKKHSANALVAFKGGNIILRIKDDCIPFNPKEMAEMATDTDRFDNMGIRMVFNLADEISYQNMLGLNVLTITLKEENLLASIKTDFLLEKTLKALSPDLHERFRSTVFSVQKILSNYRLLFPEYTDHSELHSMTVIDSCNRLIGTKQIALLNADEIYILLVGCYLHDVGMGIGEKDFEDFKDTLKAQDFFKSNPNASISDCIRVFHNEFSGLFVEKYADLFDIPSPEHRFAIKQIVRGHRKTDLYDENEYPPALKLPNGNEVRLPYLAALIRLSDEIDVVATRNPLILFDGPASTNEHQLIEDKKLDSIKSMRMTHDAFILSCHNEEAEMWPHIEKMTVKMQETLDSCRDVVRKKTPFEISQKKIILKKI
ncbi:MAG: hypothetical protein E7300_01920 [Lachnospiraceae bacterium]|nr:hypothetical protein [Lachnospiraceae bacterium]